MAIVAACAAVDLVPADEPGRLAALAEHDILDTPPEEAFDAITRLAARICAAPMSTITLIDGNRQWFKSTFALAATETPRDGFCSHCILQPELMTVPDALDDPRLCAHPYVVGAPFIRFYAGVPLISAEGFALGTLCVLDTEPRELTDEQASSLLALGGQVMALLELRRSLVRERRRLAGPCSPMSRRRASSPARARMASPHPSGACRSRTARSPSERS